MKNVFNVNQICRAFKFSMKLMGEKFLFMFAIRIVFAIIPVITIKVTGIMFELLNIREFTAMLIGILIMYVILLMINKMQIIVYERYIIQYIYMIEFERETKKILHEKCLKLKAEDFNDTSINTKTFEARTASINIFRTMEILVDFVAIVVEVLLIVGYFITLNTWYSVMIVCAIVPSVIRQVKKLTQQRTVQELLLKKKQNIQMLEKTVYSPKYFYENKVINNFNYIITKWKSKQEEYNSICREQELKNCVIDCAFGLLSQVGYAGGFLVAVAIYLQDKNIANFSASFIAFSMLNDIIQNFIDEYGYLSQFIIMTEPFFKFMDLHDDIEVNKYGDKIILENVSYKYDNKMVLDGINLEINRGEKVALLGRNGSGKSTLLKIITGIYKPYSGTVTTFIKNNSEISAIFQNYGRYPLTVEKNITIANDYNTINCIDVGKLLDMVGMDYIDKNEMLGKELGDRELSGGEWQRIAIARCMMRVVGNKAKLLIMDEPDSEIDMVGEHMICDIMDMFPDDMTVIVITHRQNSALLKKCNRSINLG